ncbi:hypothetical protein HanRHA438_Chr06g0251961 [Helianthus annuus]|nr:hypothetical protein HanRHA438_Chr06g0251961 [Helianthus annuus]
MGYGVRPQPRRGTATPSNHPAPHRPRPLHPAQDVADGPKMVGPLMISTVNKKNEQQPFYSLTLQFLSSREVKMKKKNSKNSISGTFR